MSKVFFTGDTHFFHSNIIKYCGRPFDTVETMNEQLVINWNNTVGKDDIVYHVGDVALGGEKHKFKIKSIIESLNGHKYLIKGNHDTHPDQWYNDIGFEKVYDKGILLDDFYWVTHKPVELLNDSMPYCNIHGHTHHTSMDFENYYNVSVEVTDYAPVNFDVIKNKFEVRYVTIDELLKTND